MRRGHGTSLARSARCSRPAGPVGRPAGPARRPAAHRPGCAPSSGRTRRRPPRRSPRRSPSGSLQSQAAAARAPSWRPRGACRTPRSRARPAAGRGGVAAPPGRTGCGQAHGVAGAQRLGAVRRRRDPVAVVPAQRREPGVEASGGTGVTARTRTSGGRHAGQPAHQPRRVEIGGEVGVGHLAGGVHPGVGAPGHGQRDRGAQHRRQRVVEHPAHRPRPGWLRPAGEVGAVVGEMSSRDRGNEPAVRRTAGSVGSCGRVRTRPSPAARRAARSPAASAASAVANQTSATVSIVERRVRARGRASSRRCP